MDEFKIGDRVVLSDEGKEVIARRSRDREIKGEVVGFSRDGCIRVKRDDAKNVDSWHPSFWRKETARMEKKIITSNVRPPIPPDPTTGKFGHDWVAYYEGEEESGHCGWGETEEEAIKDLHETWDEEED